MRAKKFYIYVYLISKLVKENEILRNRYIFFKGHIISYNFSDDSKFHIQQQKKWNHKLSEMIRDSHFERLI